MFDMKTFARTIAGAILDATREPEPPQPTPARPPEPTPAREPGWWLRDPVMPSVRDLPDLIGQRVLIRDHMAGVYVGTLRALDLGQKTWRLDGARQVHFWAGCAATPGIAARGIAMGYKPNEGSHVGPPITICGADLVSVIAVSPEAWEALLAYPEWRP
jgi:hypothetical protein